MKSATVLVCIFFVAIGSCTYQRPFFSVRRARANYTDTLLYHEVTRKQYLYYSVKNIARLGVYSVRAEYDSSGRKIRTHYWKTDRMHSLNAKWYKKTVYYDLNGKIKKITKEIAFNGSLFSKMLVEKTILFDNGKRLKLTKD